jgi:hypothetical protein
MTDSLRVARGSQPNTRTAFRYNSRINPHAILRPGHETAAHAMCDEYWHGYTAMTITSTSVKAPHHEHPSLIQRDDRPVRRDQPAL